MFSLAADGRTNSRGLPNPCRLAVIMREHFDLVRRGFPPAWIEKSGLLLGAPLGYEAWYASGPGEAAPAAA